MSGGRDHVGHCSRKEKTRETKDAMDDNMEKWTKMSFEKLLRETEDRWRWNKLVHEATNPQNKDG